MPPAYQVHNSLKLEVMYNDGTQPTTLIFEPTYNGGMATSTWQSRDAASSSSVWRSSRPLLNDICSFDCLESWDTIKDALPDAYVTNIPIETGSGTPGALGNVDAFTINGTTYEFEPAVGLPTSIEECQNGGWAGSDTPRPFANQGDCIQYLNTASTRR